MGHDVGDPSCAMWDHSSLSSNVDSSPQILAVEGVYDAKKHSDTTKTVRICVWTNTQILCSQKFNRQYHWLILPSRSLSFMESWLLPCRFGCARLRGRARLHAFVDSVGHMARVHLGGVEHVFSRLQFPEKSDMLWEEWRIVTHQLYFLWAYLFWNWLALLDCFFNHYFVSVTFHWKTI